MFQASHTQVNGEPQNLKSESPLIISDKVDVELRSQELELLLVTIKNTLFKGEYVEILYNLTLKLQQGYVHCKSK